MRVRFSRLASQDLLDIALFIAADNPTRAQSFTDELQAACTALADHPARYAVIPRFLPRQLRRRPYGNYAIFYEADPREIRIVRIIAAAMDLERALGRD